MIGVATTASTVMIVRWASACSLPFGASSGPMKMITIGTAMTVAISHRRKKRRAWLGSLAPPPAEAGMLGDDIQEPAHVAERLHRSSVAGDVARGARHEA